MVALCTKCGLRKSAEEFHKDNSRPSKLHRWCKQCHRDNYVHTPERRRSQHLRDKYGLTEEAYMEMYEMQGGKCAICSCSEVEGAGKVKKVLNVDHCHTSGAIRGLLCSKCNSGIGLLDDDLDKLRKAVQYLEQHRRMEGYVE